MTRGNSVAVQADGKLLAVRGETGSDFALIRYDANGTLDTAFDGDGKVSTSVTPQTNVGKSAILLPDGAIIAAGYGQTESGFDFALIKYNTDGSLDPAFGIDGKVITDYGNQSCSAQAVSIQADGKIVVAGSTDNGTTTDFAISRYNPDGSFDTTLGGDGRVTTAVLSGTSIARAVMIQPDGKIVVAGYSNTGSNNDFAVVRYNADGSLDSSFDADGKVTTAVSSSDDLAYAVAVQPDGKIIVAGEARGSSNQDFGVIRYKFRRFA